MNIVLTPRSRVLLGLVAIILVCVLVLRQTNQDLHSTVPIVTTFETGTTTEIATVGPILAASNPVTLRIPDLNIDVPFGPELALANSGEIAVPDGYDTVGWYKYSPTPGQLGPAIVLGHVDSYAGPAVFFSLGQLQPGDTIFIDREDGTQAEFQVELLERYEQSDFPTQKVYGNINYAGLRLITCSGIYERGAARYTHNLVVYARLVEPT